MHLLKLQFYFLLSVAVQVTTPVCTLPKFSYFRNLHSLVFREEYGSRKDEPRPLSELVLCIPFSELLLMFQ